MPVEQKQDIPVMAMPESLLFLQINYFTFQTYLYLLYSHLSRREEKLKDDADEGQNIILAKASIPLLFSSLIVLCLVGCAEDSNILDNEQSRQLGFSVTTHGWNNSNSSSSDSKPDSRATPISGNTFDTSKSFNVIADVNKGGNWSTEINNETASYSTQITSGRLLPHITGRDWQYREFLCLLSHKYLR